MRFNDDLINRLMRYPRSASARLRVLRLRVLGVRIGHYCWLRSISIPRNPWDVDLGDNVALDDGVILIATGQRANRPRIKIASGVYVNRYTIFDASEGIEVGARTMIGPHCYITDHDHGHAVGQPINSQPLVGAPVRIGCDVWIGAGAIILKGVEIGDSAIVGAGAVVTNSVASGAKVAGVPGRQIGVRA